MSKQSKTISVTIQDKDYLVGCPEGQEQALIDSANYLNSRIDSIRAGSRTVGLDKLAVMAGLNIAHELINLRSKQSSKVCQVENS